jgi:hypothetical protein
MGENFIPSPVGGRVKIDVEICTATAELLTVDHYVVLKLRVVLQNELLLDSRANTTLLTKTRTAFSILDSESFSFVSRFKRSRPSPVVSFASEKASHVTVRWP